MPIYLMSVYVTLEGNYRDTIVILFYVSIHHPRYWLLYLNMCEYEFFIFYHHHTVHLNTCVHPCWKFT